MKGILFDWIGVLKERDVGVFPFVKEVLDGLKENYKLGLITLAKDHIKEREIEINESGIKNYFDEIFIVEKKDKEEYIKAVEKMELDSEEVLVVDDRASRGIMAGIDVGCKTCWIQVGDRSFDKPTEETGEPDYKIDSIKELGEILEELKV